MRSEPSTSRGEATGLQTVGAVIDGGAQQLAAAGVREPRRQAVALWAWLAGAGVGQVWLAREQRPDGVLVQRFVDGVARRASGEPLPYVVGLAGFRTLELEVDSRVLIPRPETEGLVEHVLAWLSRHPAARVVADIGTGSGCIALALAVEGRFARVIATDVSPAALAVARRNVARVSPPVPIEVREGSGCEALRGVEVDVIVSNPPYVSAAEFEELEPSVRLFEPREALVSGDGGLAHTCQLLEEARGHLAPLGLLALEVDSSRAEDARTVATDCGWGSVRIEHDLFGRQRYLLATRE